LLNIAVPPTTGKPRAIYDFKWLVGRHDLDQKIRFNVVVYQLDSVPLKKIVAFLKKSTSRANSPDAHHR
jgi:hypothetical protein